jgi:putative sterol carrier protein
LGQKLKPEQIEEIAQVFRTLCWDFKDRSFQAWFLLEKGKIQLITDDSRVPDATITLDSSTLHDAAYGKTTFGAAFVMGKLKVKGIPALKLRKFIPLLKPFLESYREAWEGYHGK